MAQLNMMCMKLTGRILILTVSPGNTDTPVSSSRLQI